MTAARPPDGYGRRAELHGIDPGTIAPAPQADTLSMGMSGDLETAVACGATMVRIGSALFGRRDLRRK